MATIGAAAAGGTTTRRAWGLCGAALSAAACSRLWCAIVLSVVVLIAIWDECYMRGLLSQGCCTEFYTCN